MNRIDPERWRRIQPILDEALQLAPHERERWLDRTCAGDPESRTLIEQLLLADEAQGGLLDTPSGAFLGEILRDVHANAPPDATLLPDRLVESPTTTRREFLPGTILAGRYRIVSLLGRGGMGEVYRADDLRIGQAVALKFVAERLHRDPEYIGRLTSEARLARQVSHPNVCRVYDVADAEDRPFIAMEYVDGEDLASLLKRIGHLPAAKAIDIARQLCAGLEAAHRQGVLHRDLKPANIMLDGRGQVRITDFGLAVADTVLPGTEIRAGTPAYMAPEQLDGRDVTVRSDIYALGLVLYELFTGAPAFRGGRPADLQRGQDDSTPAPPARVADGVDPAIERAILSCLEPDPALRPASAAAVAATLPRQDPLSAGLTTGLTPSPDIVAASGPEGALAARTAIATLTFIVLALALLLVLTDRVSILGWAPLTRDPEVLEDHARGIIQRLGYDASRIDHASDVSLLIGTYLRYVQGHDTSPERWNHLREPGQIPSYFWYRQASRYLTPRNWDGRVSSDDPALAPGDIELTTSLTGRLIFFQAIPPDAAPSSDKPALYDWSRLFEEARLDFSQFTPATPTRNPPAATDVRAAWVGTLSDFGNYPVRVEAASHQGRPIFFELVVPWDSYWDPAAAPEAFPPTRLPAAFYLLTIMFGLVTAGILVVRNWLNGRGDRRGAFRLAAAVFIVRFSVWALGGHHVPSFWEELQMFVTAVGKSLIDAAVIWCYYLALEPHARKLHPRLIVSWTRLLRGHFRDPLVGRDVLYGVALSMITIAFWAQMYVLIPQVLQLTAPPPPAANPLGMPAYFLFLDPPRSQALLGGRHVLEAVPARVLYALGIAFAVCVLLLGMRLLFRRQWAASTAFVAITAVGAWPANFADLSSIAIACTAVGALAILCTLRIGLVSLVVLWFCLGVWMDFPMTTRVEAPYFGAGLVGVLMIAGLAVYGAIVSTRPHRRMAPV